MRFTTQDLHYTNPKEDCYLDPEDSLYHLAYPGRSQINYKAQEHLRLKQQAQAQGIRPGSPAWFALFQ
jgi:hypothetical protein